MELFYKKIGQGQPLLLLHGLFGSSDNWLSTAKFFENRFQSFIPDLRNHGRSPHDSFMNYFSMADDIMTFLSTHGIDNPIIIGHSMGGKLAMHLALEYPEVAFKIIVVDIAPIKYPLRQIHYINSMLKVDFDNVASRKEVFNLLSAEISDERVVQLLLKNLEWKSRNRLGWRINLDAINSNIDNLLGAIETTSAYFKESLFIRGNLSDYIIDDNLYELQKLFPCMQLKTINNAGHWVQTDNFPDFIKEVDYFLTGK
ncbi:MAG: alpha/beta fold hydrolase [Bacteroidales bacterium]|nr:alpha/beta fold hydrolase [Bacteroidales bacterium]